ncbi:hypothetical protein ACFE04_001235 [Oxalis oulophora]
MKNKNLYAFGSKVSIPNTLKNTIRDLKEITCNSNEEEIYAMLKECSMDPNEAAQRLLSQGSFQEVTSKRERRKKSINNNQPKELFTRKDVIRSSGGRLNYSPRSTTTYRAVNKAVAIGSTIDKDIDSSSLREIKNIKGATSLASMVINTTTPASVETIETCGQTIRSIMPTSPLSSSSTVCCTPSDPIFIPSNNPNKGTSNNDDVSFVQYSTNKADKIIGPRREWKPKATASTSSQTSLACKTKVAGPSNPLSAGQFSSEATDVIKKLEDLQLQEHKPVIMPTHIQVPEIEQTKLIFGTFDPRFLPTSQVVDATIEEQSAREETNESTDESTRPIDVVTDQPNPVFEQLEGMHLPQYPPLYFPYGQQYLSPMYVSPSARHHFLANGGFPIPAGYEYLVPQYIPSTYEPFGSTTLGNSSSNEDLGASQFHTSHFYIGDQQSEGSGLWIPAYGQDMFMPADSFYNAVPEVGQHSSFAHGSFAGVYDPGQQSQNLEGGIDMAEPDGGDIYDQPQQQHPYMNWPDNY